MTKRSSSKTDRSAKWAREAERRASRATTLGQKQGSTKRRYWHGGRSGLQPGDVLRSRSVAEQEGADLSFYDMQLGYDIALTRPDRVYFSSDREFARAFAGRIQIRDTSTGMVYQQGALYRVEPVGEVEPDPDFKNGQSWCAPSARIVAVEDPSVLLDMYEANSRLGRHLAWADGSAVYTRDGRYLPSPEQFAADRTGMLAMADRLLPWTPLEHINAAIIGQPSGDRPDPQQCTSVLGAASEGVDVMRRHFERATALVAQGVTFRSGGDADLAVVNELVAMTSGVPVHEDDERGVIIAEHPRDGIVGAMVLTAFAVDERNVMMLEAIAVTPSWRGRGLGSVLLLTGQQLVPAPVVFAGGHCDPSVGRFFNQLGFTTIQPGVPLIMPFSDEPTGIDVGDEHCWFYRQGPI